MYKKFFRFFKRIMSLLSNLIESPRPLHFFISRLFVNYPFFFKFFYFKRKNYRLRISPSSIAATMYSINDSRFDFEENFLKSLVKSNDYFVDVGSNIGHLSIYLKKSIPELNCISIEANPNTFEILNNNIKLNNLNIKVFNYAIGERDDLKIKFQNSYSDDCNSVIVDKMENNIQDNLYIVKNENSILVEMKKLDTIINNLHINRNIRLLKIDTEGYEFFVLKGAKNILNKTEIIYFEYWDKLANKYDYSLNDIEKFLKEKKFDIFFIPKNFKDIKFSKLERLTNTKNFKQNQNFLAINMNFKNLF